MKDIFEQMNRTEWQIIKNNPIILDYILQNVINPKDIYIKRVQLPVSELMDERKNKVYIGIVPNNTVANIKNTHPTIQNPNLRVQMMDDDQRNQASIQSNEMVITHFSQAKDGNEIFIGWEVKHD